jgi:hypothetical protein
MNQRKVLYYPTIIAPLSWLKWATLYWDKVASIVPEQWEMDSTNNSSPIARAYEAMNLLKAEGVFEPASPRVPHAQWKVETEIKAHPDLRPTHPKVWKENGLFRIHVEKFNHGALSFLKELGLAIADEHFEWIFVEKNTFFIYMAILARNLADLDPDFTVTSTDNSEYERLIFETTSAKKGFPSLTLNLRKILPDPVPETSFETILKFRKEKYIELLSFREVIDSFQQEISKSDSYAETKEITVHYAEKIMRERAELSRSLKDSGINSVFSTAKTLIDIKSPSLWETITLTIGSAAANIPSWISGAIVAGTAGIQVGSTILEKRSQNAATIRESPFSYLYLGEKEKIIPNQS